MGYTCPECKKYERVDAGPCHHCGARKPGESSKNCDGCGALVQPNSNFGAKGSTYCKACFERLSFCYECKSPVVGEDEYVFLENNLWHRNCYPRDIKCDYCQGPILPVSAFRRVLDKNYHPKDFICTGCSKVLGDEFKEGNGWPYCLRCFQDYGAKKTTFTDSRAKVNDEQRQKELALMRAWEEKLKQCPTLGSIDIGGTGGFTIDPVTGKKKDSHHPAGKAQ